MKLDHSLLDKVYFTSDTHAFHVNITRGTSNWGDNGIFKTRDFEHWQEMTERMAHNFNSVIPKDGILFHLGDWSFNGRDKIEIFRNMLNVEIIHLIAGNHDQHIERGGYDHLFTSIQKYLELEIGSLHFALFHFPIESWNEIRRGTFHLHGHQQYVSKFLYQQDLEFFTRMNSNGDVYRVYSAPMILTADVLLDQIEILESVCEPITKTKLKTMLRELDYPMGDFKVVFDSLGLKHSGTYTPDNHKIWYLEKSGLHFSKSKQRAMEISTMAKPHLKNAICKASGQIKDILDRETSELYQMLQAYFTFDLRKKLKDLA